MANTQPARLSYSVEDSLGTRASITTYALLDPAMTVDQARLAWEAQATALSAVINVAIIGGGVEVFDTAAQLGALALPAAAAASRVEQTAVMNFGNSVNLHTFGIAVAGLSDANIVAGKVDLTEGGAVDVWVDIIEEAGTALLPQYTNNAQQPITTLKDASVSFRKRRKQLSRSSRELGAN